MRVDQAIDRLAEFNRGQLRSPKTVAFYNERLAPFAEYVGPATNLSLIEREQVRSFMASLPDRYKPETVRATMIAVKRLFGWALTEQILQASPIVGLPLPTVKGTQRPSLKIEEANALLASFPSSPTGRRWRAMTLVAIDTGLRVSELCNLKVEDIDGGRIQVRRGKGQKDRVVFMGQQAVEAVARYLGNERFDARPKFAKYLWITTTGRPVRPHQFRKALYAAGKRTSIRVYPHMLRRTFATLLLRFGGDVFSLQDLMGHSNISTTRRYVAADEERLQLVHRKAGPGDLL